MSFDPSKSYEVVEDKPASTFDPSQPFETISGDGEVTRYKAPEEQPATDWDALFSGLDQAEFGMTIFQRQAWGRLKTDTDNSKSTQAQAINQAYVSAHIPQYSPEYVTNNWDAGVKESFAKNVLGIDHSGITDEEFYEAVKDHEYFKKIYRRIEFENEDPIGKINLLFQMASAKTYQNVNKMWDKANTPFFPLPSAPQMPDIRGLGPNNPAILAATWNSIKPLIEGLETPLGVGTMGTVPVLAALSRVSKAAKAALFGVEGLFTALMAKGTIEAAKAAPEVFEDPNSTLQQRIEAVGVPVASGLATVAGAVGAVYTLKTPAGRAELTFNMQGKTPEEIAILYRQEAAASTKPKEIEALNQAADAFDQLSESALKPKEEGAVAEVVKKADEPESVVKEEAQPKAPVIEELENGGFVVTQDGKLIDYSKTLDEANELAGKVQADAVKPVSQPEATKATEVVSEPVKSPATKTVGVRNADVFEQAKKMGLPEPTKGEGLKFTEAVDRANKAFEADPDAGRKLIVLLKENPRPITGEQNAILARELTRLVKERELAETAFIEATNMGDPIAIADAKAQVNKAISDFAEAADLDAQVGTQNALGLALRQLRLKEDYSLASMERRMQVANEGKPLTEVQSQRVRDLHSRLQAAEKQLNEYRAGKTPKKATKTITERLSEQADAARERIKARLAEGRQQSGLDPLDLADHAIIGADYLAKGVVKAAEWTDAMVKEFGERIRPYLAEIRAQAEEAHTVANQEKRLKAYKTRKGTAIDELKRRIEEEDFSPKQKPEPLHLDAEANRLQAEQDILRLEYDRLLEKNRYENLTPLQKAGENIVTAWDSTRAVLAGFEFSSVGRQGATRLFSSPKKTISAMADAFRAFASNEAGAHAINLKVLNSPDAALARQNKLALIDEKISLSKQEENYMGKLVGKIPGVRNFEQFARVFLNKVRLDMWNEMRKDFPDASPKLLADFTNAATGRGSLGKLEAAAVPLNRILFSPRFLASRIQMSTGYYVWKAAINGDKAAVKAVSREYAKALAGYGTFLTALYFGAQAYTDEEVSISANPTSSDFLKMKIGNTRLDLGAGNLQPLVFLSQMATGERTTAKGETVPIRGEDIPFGGEDAYGRATSFARSKFNPSLSKSVDFLTGTNIVGEPATLTDLLYPATWGDIVEVWQQEYGLPEKSLISLLGVFGAGVQTYDPNKPGKNTPSPFRDGQEN